MAPFGETVLAWRLTRGLTQAALAQRARLSRPNLSAIERGDREVTLKTLRALADALGVRPGQLADGELPRDEAAQPDRAGLERVARAAVGGRRVADRQEADLARALGGATAARTRPAGARPRPTRGGDLAYFRLRTMASPSVVTSLLERLGDELERR